jgi:hypothetical protein
MSKYYIGVKNSNITIKDDISNTAGASSLGIRSNNMSFTPSGINQLSATYRFMVGTGAAYTPLVTITESGVAVSATTPSISAATGALVVAGGVGIVGDLYVGGSINGPINTTSYIASTSGSASSPVFTFLSETTKGLFSSGANQLALSVNSTNCFNINANTANQTYISIGRTTTNSPTAAVGDGNYLVYNGTLSDPGAIIAERIWGLNEKSELLLWKGNDITGATGADRIRCRAAEIVFQAFGSTETVTLPTVSDDNTKMTIGASGITTSSPLYVSSNIYYNALASALATNTTLVVDSPTTGGKCIIPLNSASAFTVTLPSTTGNSGLIYIFINIGTASVSITTNISTEYFNGNSQLTTVSASQYDTMTVICYGTNWFII